jgi:hypothetical protein
MGSPPAGFSIGDRMSMLNAMTVDLEDWAQSVLDPRHPITEHVVGNT